MKKTIVLIADVRNWAFDNIAKYLEKILCDKYEVTILYYSDYKIPRLLLKKLAEFKNLDFIHFFHRRYLNLFLESIEKINEKDEGLNKFLSAAVTTVVPDHLFLQTQKDVKFNKYAFLFSDYYYMISKILYEIYSKIPLYPKPWKEVIYDNLIAENDDPNFENNENLVVTWIGNSAWGEWDFDKDYDPKGYNKIIEPVMDRLRKEIKAETIIADGKVKKRSKKEIFDLLKRTDILLIAATTDGTPLPLIEAMSSGCTVISTENGIAPELLDKDFIIARNIEAFVNLAKKLNEDREKLSETKKKNYETFKKIFKNEDFFASKWSNLIENSIEKAKNRREEKLLLLKNISKQRKKDSGLIDKLRSIVERNPNLKIFFKALLKIKIIKLFVRRIMFFFNQKTVKLFQNEFIESLGKINLDQNYIALYNPIYPGVRNSSVSLFENNLALPTVHYVYDLIGYPKWTISKIAKELLNKKVKNLLFSGGGKLALQLADYIYESGDMDINMYYVWHGSPAQWANRAHLKEFESCYYLYRKGAIGGIITLKKDLELTLRFLGIKSYLLQNYVPYFPNQVKSKISNKFTVGIWGASDIWVKNPYPQISAVASFGEGEIKCLTNFQIKKPIEKIIEGKDFEFFEQNLHREDLLSLISSTDLTIYVTNTECSPMIALESLGLGVPCLIGPTSALFEEDEYLRNMLTVERVDCPYAIYSSIKRIMENFEEIKSKLPDFVESYNKKAEYLKEKFIRSIS